MSVSTSTRHLVMLHDDTICAVATVPPEGNTDRLVVLVHGGPGGAKEGPDDLYVHLAEILAARGIASFRFDFLGAGESSGHYRDMTISGQVEQLLAVVEHARDTLHPTSLALVGESYGATIAILGLSQLDVRCLVLLWPAIWLLDRTFASYVTPDRLREAEQRGFIVEEGEQVGLPFLQEVQAVKEVSDRLHGLTVPTLWIHGDADQEVPYQQSQRAARLVSGPKRVVIVPGGDHTLARPAEREVVNHEVTDWLVSHR